MSWLSSVKSKTIFDLVVGCVDDRSSPRSFSALVNQGTGTEEDHSIHITDHHESVYIYMYII